MLGATKYHLIRMELFLVVVFFIVVAYAVIAALGPISAPPGAAAEFGLAAQDYAAAGLEKGLDDMSTYPLV